MTKTKNQKGTHLLPEPAMFGTPTSVETVRFYFLTEDDRIELKDQPGRVESSKVELTLLSVQDSKKLHGPCLTQSLKSFFVLSIPGTGVP